ncbi:MAG: methyltransferase domain-containing protein [Caldilineaceae bacterium]|nr:methyltransferase domain-containing protein [Caldilineaceae bacterium]
MNHADHVNLLRNGIPYPGGRWADLGAGSGAFTLALADLIESQGEIYAVDRDGAALQRLERTVHARMPAIALHCIVGDFAEPLPLPPLDGVLMANSLHFVQHKEAVVRLVQGYLKPNCRLIVVEYNTDRGNRWVPYPFSYSTWQRLATRCGFDHIELLATRPSSFLGEFYACASWRNADTSSP